MSRGYGSSVIPIAVFFAILLIVFPVGASNTTTTTTVATTQTTNVTSTTTDTTTQTSNVTPTTTITTAQTTNATPATTATPTKTTVVTTANPTISVVETETTGSVTVYSSPTGASILIDGVYSGTTPGTVNGVPAGNHILRLALSGYYDYEGSIYIVPGQTNQGYGTLQPMNQVTAAPTAIIPVILPVFTVTPEPTQDPGPFGNSSVLAAIIGSVAVLIGSAATIYTHVKPPKKG